MQIRTLRCITLVTSVNNANLSLYGIFPPHFSYPQSQLHNLSFTLLSSYRFIPSLSPYSTPCHPPFQPPAATKGAALAEAASCPLYPRRRLPPPPPLRQRYPHHASIRYDPGAQRKPPHVSGWRPRCCASPAGTSGDSPGVSKQQRRRSARHSIGSKRLRRREKVLATVKTSYRGMRVMQRRQLIWGMSSRFFG